MTVTFIPFDNTVIVPNGQYWCITETEVNSLTHKGKIKQNKYLTVNLKRVNNKMTTDVSNQVVTHISQQPCKPF